MQVRLFLGVINVRRSHRNVRNTEADQNEMVSWNMIWKKKFLKYYSLKYLVFAYYNCPKNFPCSELISFSVSSGHTTSFKRNTSYCPTNPDEHLLTKLTVYT